MHFIYLQCTLSKHSYILLQQLLTVSGQKKQIYMESNKIVLVKFDTLAILCKFSCSSEVKNRTKITQRVVYLEIRVLLTMTSQRVSTLVTTQTYFITLLMI